MIRGFVRATYAANLDRWPDSRDSCRNNMSVNRDGTTGLPSDDTRQDYEQSAYRY